MRLREIQAGVHGVIPAAARAGLTVLSWGWGAAWALQREARGLGIGRSLSLGVPVVSVGNLVAGGTGKTPFTAWLARRLIRLGRHPGILSRGYGPPSAESALSDEGAVLARMLGPQVPQVEDPDRVRGGRRLLSEHPDVNVVLLDDGFQHRRLARDVDVVLLDASCPFGFGRLLPRGLLREPPVALVRADLVVLTRAERSDPRALEDLKRRVTLLTPAPVAVARTVPKSIEIDGRTEPASTLRGRTVYACCGIGNPEAFAGLLSDIGGRLVGRRFLADHARMEESEWSDVVAEARRAGADVVATTRKDAVKVAHLPPSVAVLDVETTVVEGEDAVDRVLQPFTTA